MKCKHWTKILIFALIAVVGLLWLSSFLKVNNNKDVLGVYSYYREPEDSIDVALIGASEIYTSYYAPLAYEKAGFTSYALSTSTMTASLIKYAVKAFEERQHPQLYVISTWPFCYDIQVDETSFRKFLDSVESPAIRNEAIREIVPDELKSSFRFPFLKYHVNWNMLQDCLKVYNDKQDIRAKGYSVTKGYATTTQIIEDPHESRDYHISDAGFAYLEDLLNYLHEQNIQNVLFVRAPEMVDFVNTDSYYEMIDKIRDAGYDYLNLDDAMDEMGIVVEHDFYNEYHLNIFGTERFTEYLADYIMQNYEIDTASHRQEVAAEWDECASHNASLLASLEKKTEENRGKYIYTQKDLLE